MVISSLYYGTLHDINQINQTIMTFYVFASRDFPIVLFWSKLLAKFVSSINSFIHQTILDYCNENTKLLFKLEEATIGFDGFLPRHHVPSLHKTWSVIMTTM